LRLKGAGKLAIETAQHYQKLRKEREDAETAKKKAEQNAEREKQTLDNLKAQLVALRSGAEEAARLKDIQSGMSSIGSQQAAAIRKQIDAIKEKNKLEKQAKKLIEDNKTAQEKFVDQYKELMKLKVDGLIDPSTFGRAFEKIKKDLNEGLKKEQKVAKSPGDLQASSSRFLARGGSTLDRQRQQQIDVAKQTKDIIAESKDLLGKQAKALNRIAVKVESSDGEVFP